MRRTIWLPFILLVLFLVSACGGSAGPAASPSEAAPTAAPQLAATDSPASAPTNIAPVTPTGLAATPSVAETPAAPTHAPGDVQEVALSSDPEGYHPNRITVKAGSLVRFTVTNTDSDLHDLFDRKSKFEIEFPPLTTVTYEWVAPQEPGLYVAECTYHAGLFLKIDVQK